MEKCKKNIQRISKSNASEGNKINKAMASKNCKLL